MRDLYMKTGQGFLLVFSISQKSSLTELMSLRDEIIRIKDDDTIPIVLVGNKADLEDQRAVPRTKGFSISQRWGAPYYEASARTKSEYSPQGLSYGLPDLLQAQARIDTNKRKANVDEVFVDLCRQMLRRDDDNDITHEDEDKFDPYSISYYKNRRKRKEGGGHNRPRCVIL